MSKKIVLAYSGGLDTSVILKWLKNEKKYDVIAYIADVGQNEDFKAIEKKAYNTGASKVYIEDLKREFITDYILEAIRSNAVYEGRYLMGTSLARPIIAKRQIEIAKKENAVAVAHGATGKGNDQVRFELTYQALAPELEIISPWKDQEFLDKFSGRTDMISYAEKNNIPIEQSLKKPYSNDLNLFHLSHEAGILEDPNFRPTEDIFRLTVSPQAAPDQETIIEIEFENGNPTKVKNLNDRKEISDIYEMFVYLNKIAGENGIGRVDMVENRFVGIKSRGIYETPGGTVLMTAHRDLEGLTMDREVMHIRDSLIPRFSELIYYGMWFSPEFQVLKALFDKSQEYISGKVKLALYKGNCTPVGRESQYALYDADQSSMDSNKSYNQVDAKGFIRINAIRLINANKRLIQE